MYKPLLLRFLHQLFQSRFHLRLEVVPALELFIALAVCSSFIITNEHVIDTAAQGGTVRVELNNGDIERASIVAKTVLMTLQLLKIERGT